MRSVKILPSFEVQYDTEECTIFTTGRWSMLTGRETGNLTEFYWILSGPIPTSLHRSWGNLAHKSKPICMICALPYYIHLDGCTVSHLRARNSQIWPHFQIQHFAVAPYLARQTKKLNTRTQLRIFPYPKPSKSSFINFDDLKAVLLITNFAVRKRDRHTNSHTKRRNFSPPAGACAVKFSTIFAVVIDEVRTISLTFLYLIDNFPCMGPGTFVWNAPKDENHHNSFHFHFISFIKTHKGRLAT